MKSFIIKLFIFSVLTILLDYSIGIASNYLQNNSKGGTTGKDNYIKNTLNEDIVIMGSSRAQHHYIPEIISDSLNKSVYNAGMDGKGIILNYGLLLEVLKRHKPETIIYELTPSFDWRNGDNTRYLPHLRLAYELSGIDSIFWDVDYTERFKMLSRSYRVNSLVPHLIYDNIHPQKDNNNGYVPNYGVYKGPNKYKKDYSIQKEVIDSLKIKYINKLIDLCKKENIKLIFSISPALYDTEYYEYGRKIADINKLQLIDSYTSDQFEDYSIYQDENHLNDKGAQIYTKWIISKINPE